MKYLILTFVAFALMVGVAPSVEQSKGSKKPEEQTVNALLKELAADGALTKKEAEVVAKTAAKRLWWPDADKFRVGEVKHQAGWWTVRLTDDGRLATRMCEIRFTKSFFSSARHLPSR